MESDTSQTGLVSTPRRGSKPLPQPQVISSRTGQTFLEMTPNYLQRDCAFACALSMFVLAT